MKRRYGLLGLLSLIGVLGLVSGNRVYLPFLAWAVFFRYLFVEADEMFTANLGRAAAWAFYLQLAATTGITLLAAGDRPAAGDRRWLRAGADGLRPVGGLVRVAGAALP